MFSKKFFLSALLIPFLLAGCGPKEPPPFEDRVPEKDSSSPENLSETTTFAGVIGPLQISLYSQGTHQLKTDEGSVVFLKSQTISLSRYFEKRVKVSGHMEKVEASDKPVLNVIEVVLETPESEIEKIVENQKAGFRFTTPATWEIEEEGDQFSLYAKGLKIITIALLSFADDEEWEKVVRAREKAEGTVVTVGAEKSLRYTENDAVRFYVPNTSRQKIYKIEFSPLSGKEEEQKPLFYQFIEGFTPLYFQKPEGRRCGGAANLRCEEGYRCELLGPEKEAAGVCVPTGQAEAGLACPFIPLPKDCANYQVAEFNKNGCPMRYQCVKE